MTTDMWTSTTTERPPCRASSRRAMSYPGFSSCRSPQHRVLLRAWPPPCPCRGSPARPCHRRRHRMRLAGSGRRGRTGSDGEWGLLARTWPPEPGSATIADDGEEAMGRDSADSLAVVVFREDGVWQSGVLPERVTDDLGGLIAVARQQPGENGAVALVNVADEFFVAGRGRGEEVRLVLSGGTGAGGWGLGRDGWERAGVS